MIGACAMVSGVANAMRHTNFLPSSALRAEWAKARARAARWLEQVRLLHEEMRRFIASTRHEASEWNLRRSHRQGQASPTKPVDDELDEGLKAYADEHAAMETAIADNFEAKWAAIRFRVLQALQPPSADVAGASRPPVHALIHLDVNQDEDSDD